LFDVFPVPLLLRDGFNRRNAYLLGGDRGEFFLQSFDQYFGIVQVEKRIVEGYSG
jgi:hypothetical protein